MAKRTILNKISTCGAFWRVRGWGSQTQRRKAEFGRVQKVNTVTKAENIRSYEALESCQDIEKGNGKDLDSCRDKPQEPNDNFCWVL